MILLSQTQEKNMTTQKSKKRILTPGELDRISAAVDRLPQTLEDEIVLGQLIFRQHKKWAHLFTKQKFDTGAIIFAEKDPGDTAYIIMDGKLAVIKGDFSAPIILGCREKEQSIGEMALLDGSPRSASVVVLEPVELMEISRETFQILLHESPDFTESILRLLSARLREASQAVESATIEKAQDPLTGLYNRRYMEIMLSHELQRADRAGYPVSIIMMDIDHFKKLNDTYGHPAGDQVLRSLAALMKSQVRRADVACRYGGEEFLIILPETSLEVAAERADTLRFSFSKLIIEHGGQTMQANLSLGVAAFPTHAQIPPQLIQVADTALYAAKTGGRNRVVVAD
jgi:diguanylate cyclase (GGDEF)-like protein